MPLFDEVSIGQSVVIDTGNITNEDGDNTDPATVTLKIKTPDGVVQSYSIGDLRHDGTGQYSLVYTPSLAGRYYVEITTTLPNTSGADSFDVATSAFV